MSYTPQQLAAAYPERTIETLKEFSDFEAALKLGLAHLLVDPQKSVDDQVELIKQILPNLSSKCVGFFRLVISEKKVKQFPKILNEFIKLLKEKATTGEIITASGLSDTELGSIKEKIAKKTGTPVLLKNKVDPKIIGGVILKINDKTIDKSYRTRLKALR